MSEGLGLSDFALANKINIAVDQSNNTADAIAIG